MADRSVGVELEQLHSSGPPAPRPCPAWIYPSAALDGLAVSLPLGTVPGWLSTHYSGGAFLALGAAASVRGLCAFFSVPLIGRASDLHGYRRPFLRLTVLLSGLPCIAAAVVCHPLSYLVVYALAGTGLGTLALASAWLVDQVEPCYITREFGRVIAVYGGAFGVGPVLGLGLAAGLGTRAVFIASAGTVGLNLALLGLLPEKKLPSSAAVVEQEARSFCTWSTPVRDLGLRGLMLTCFFNNLSEQCLLQLALLYLAHQLEFNDIEIGAFVLEIATVTALALLVVLSLLQRLIGELYTLRVALLANMLATGLLSVATAPWHVYALISLLLVATLVAPCLSAICSKVCVQREHGHALGEVMAVLQALRSVTEGLAPVLFGLWLSHSQGTRWPGAPFLGASGCVLVAALVSWFGVDQEVLATTRRGSWVDDESLETDGADGIELDSEVAELEPHSRL